jgi:pantoate--beta-alanine ligase
MKLFVTNLELNHYLNNLKQSPELTKPLCIGFVPTMGALHVGHISLIKQAKSVTDIVVCSIFVNPTQFNDAKDLEKYPRTPEKDIDMLEKADCDVLFMPTVTEIYPKVKNFAIDLSPIDGVLEGEFRPGHFNGVAQVVHRLFEIVKPNKAFFGLKDFQQVMVVKKVAEKMPFPLEIVPCEISREDSGLAMSSRNMRLSEEERDIAANISRILFYAKSNQKNFKSAKDLKNICLLLFNEVKDLKLDYLEIVDMNNLNPIEGAISPNAIILCAAFVGSVRLIDNLTLS